MLPAFEIVHRLRPVTLVARERTTGFVAPYAAVETELGTHDVAGRVVAGFRGPDGLRLEGWYDGGGGWRASTSPMRPDAPPTTAAVGTGGRTPRPRRSPPP